MATSNEARGPVIRCVVRVGFFEGTAELSSVYIDTARGTTTFVEGELYPVELRLVAKIVDAIREQKDRWPFDRSGTTNGEAPARDVREAAELANASKVKGGDHE